MKKLALVGAGGIIAGAHAKGWRGIGGVEVAAAVEPDAAAAERARERFGCPVFASLEEALEKSDADLVDLCTPTPTHAPLAIRALAAGRDVICEKPIARNLRDAEAMIEAAERAGRRLFIGHVVRFFPEYVKARALVGEGALGRVRTARLSRVGGPMERWFADEAASGGVLLDLSIHDLDWLLWTFGPAESIHAVRSGEGGKQYVLAKVRMASGVVAFVESSWTHPEFAPSFDLAGERGVLSHAMRERGDVLRLSAAGEAEREIPVPKIKGTPYRAELAHFMDVMDGRAEPVVTARDAVEALRLALAGLESIERGGMVQITSAE